MILTCPSCETRYQVDEAAVDRAAGRQVRCANCGYLWHFAPALVENLPVEGAPENRPTQGRGQADAATAEVLETSLSGAATEPLDLGSAAAPVVAAQRHGHRALLELGALLVLGTVVLVAILARNTIVQTWPDAAKIYETVALKTASPADGLEIAVTPLQNEGSFLVNGEITNTTEQARSVPPLRVALRDSTRKEIELQILDPPVGTLQPGAVARFRAVFDHPNVTATDVAVTFGSE